MDPYLEPHWLDVHTKLVAYAADGLNQQLPTDLVASTEERIAIEGAEDDRLLAPDGRIFEPPADSPVIVEESAGPAVASLPYRLLAQVEPIIERFIKIIDVGIERLVTVIEFVSPTNKRGEGLRAFRSKRAELVASGVNFVEIDLVRAGDWRALLKPHGTRKHASLYRATVRVPRDPAAVYFQPITLRDRLPDLPLPLRRDDPIVKLDLQPLLDRAYDNGRYARRIDYRRDPDPALDAEDAAWADQLLRSAQRR
jgi:hypothetical protein